MTTAKKVAKALKRDKLSDYLPYLAFDKSNNEFINTDDTFAYAYECDALYFSHKKISNVFTSILKQDYAKGATLQLILFADTNIKEYCEVIASGDKMQSELTKKMGNHHLEFIQNINSYKLKTKGNRLKNYRLFVCLKTTKSLNEIVRHALEESLIGARVNPRKMDAGDLLSLLRQLLNGFDKKQRHYDNNKPIAKQAIFSDTEIDFSPNKHITINGKPIAIITPKCFPEGKELGLSEISVNELIGSYNGDDLEQIPSGFIYSCNILLDKVDGELQRKQYLAVIQKAGSKLSNSINDRIMALSDAVKNLGSEHYLRFIPSLVIFAEDEDEMAVATTRAIRLFEKQGFVMQQESAIKHMVFLMSLPFGLYRGKNNSNITLFDRHFIASSKAIATQLPIQSDFKGFGAPVVPFVGRKGGIQGLDLFGAGANNHNFLCCATSGSGKSFFINWLIAYYYATGAKIRINDIGGSYKKITQVFKGSYIDITDKSVNLNPFQSCAVDDEDVEHDIDTIKNIIGQMCYADTGQSLTDSESNLLRHAIKDTIARGDIEFGIESVQDYLVNEKKQGGEIAQNEELVKAAKQMSFNLCEFARKGQHGPLFNGLRENKWQDDSLVVLEMEALKQSPSLMSVVSLQVINTMTQEMYLGDRSIKKINIFDEVASMFNSSNRLGDVVEDGYRRARKYNGSFGTIFQSVMDTKLFGRVGDVMRMNAAFKFYLESDVYQEAIDAKVLNYSGLAAELLKSIKSNKPNYSELFADTPGGAGIMRLIVGPFGMGLATTDANEVSEIESYQKQGASIEDALEMFAAKRKPTCNPSI